MVSAHMSIPHLLLACAPSPVQLPLEPFLEKRRCQPLPHPARLAMSSKFMLRTQAKDKQGPYYRDPSIGAGSIVPGARKAALLINIERRRKPDIVLQGC